MLTLETSKGFFIDVGDLVTFQLQRVQEGQVREDLGRYVAELIVRQTKGVQAPETYKKCIAQIIQVYLRWYTYIENMGFIT